MPAEARREEASVTLSAALVLLSRQLVSAAYQLNP